MKKIKKKFKWIVTRNTFPHPASTILESEYLIKVLENRKKKYVQIYIYCQLNCRI